MYGNNITYEIMTRHLYVYSTGISTPIVMV